MYRIVGTDQNETGPISAEEVCAWIEDRRATAHSRLKEEGAGEWKSLSEFPEFADALAGRGMAPRLPAGGEGGSGSVRPIPTSRLAIASLALGLLGFLGVTAMSGLILGLWAQFKISRSGGLLQGSLVAVWGMVLSGLMLLFFIPAAVGWYVPGYLDARRQARESQCFENAREIVQAIRTYADARQGKLPPVVTWSDAIVNEGMIRSSDVFVCPSAPQFHSGFAFNKHLEGKTLAELDPATVLIFESNGEWNAHGDMPNLALSRHGPRSVIGFADGSVKSIQGWQFSQLRWAP